jgi:hypothetical protein
LPHANLYGPQHATTTAELSLTKAQDLHAPAGVAGAGGKAGCEELAEAHRRLGARPASLAQATDAEVETMARRMVGQSPQK